MCLGAFVLCAIVLGLNDQCQYARKSVWDKLDGNTDWDEIMELIPQYAREWVAQNPHANLDQLCQAKVELVAHINSRGHKPFATEGESYLYMLSEGEMEDAFEKAVCSQVYVPGADKNVLPPFSSAAAVTTTPVASANPFGDATPTPEANVEVRRANPVEPEAVPIATPDATSQTLSSEQATAAFNWLQDRLQKPHAKSVSYDSKTDSYTWIGPKYGKPMSMPRGQFEAEIWEGYIKSNRTETSPGSKSGSEDTLADPEVRKAQPVHRVLKYHTDVWVQEPDGRWVHIQKHPYWADE